MNNLDLFLNFSDISEFIDFFHIFEIVQNFRFFLK